MQSFSGFRLRWPARRSARTLPYDVTEGVLIVAIAAAGAALFWTIVKPMGPVGRWQAVGSSVAVADLSILTRFDPFFRSAPTGTTAITSLPLKLFGVRLDQAMGRGSAIIATPDGLQNSYAVGDEIVPGVKLKAVAFDNVTIERGGATEQLFLDQSVGGAAPAAGSPPVVGTPGVPPPGGAPMLMQAPAMAPAPLTAQSLATGINFAPRMEKGAVTGFVVGPKGTGDVFASTGLQQGDVVTQINGRSIRSIEDATAAMSSVSPAQTTFTVDRGGKAVSVVPGAAK
ncbi:MAG: type II secretion system protein N [Sphingomonadales bacterium]